MSFIEFSCNYNMQQLCYIHGTILLKIQAIICSKPTTKTLEEGVKHVHS